MSRNLVTAAPMEDMRKSCEIYQNLKKLLASKGYTVSVGDEGGFAPKISRHDDVLKTIMLLTAFPKMRELERAGLVHRLDRETSGVMIVAKTAEAQANLAAQFQGRQVSKLYNSVLCGEVPDDEGEIDVPIGRIAGGRIKASPIGRPSLTLYHESRHRGGPSGS